MDQDNPKLLSLFVSGKGSLSDLPELYINVLPKFLCVKVSSLIHVHNVHVSPT